MAKQTKNIEAKIPPEKINQLKGGKER